MDTAIITSLESLPHYQKYKCMLPHVGSQFNSEGHKRLLLVGESHFLPPASTAHLDAERWYQAGFSLHPTEIDWIHTSNVLRGSGHSIFKSLQSAFSQVGFSRDEWPEHIAYMNYYLRPADTGRSFKDIATDLDQEQASDNLKSVIDILQPELICFISKYAFEEAKKRAVFEHIPEGSDYTYVNHPTCSWWNRVTCWEHFEGKTSKEYFVEFLRNSFMKN